MKIKLLAQTSALALTMALSGIVLAGGQKAEGMGDGSSQAMSDSEESSTTRFSRMDNNSDGYLTPSEVDSGSELSGQWDSIDTNQDNQIDRAEFSAFEADGSGSHSKMKSGGSNY